MLKYTDIVEIRAAKKANEETLQQIVCDKNDDSST